MFFNFPCAHFKCIPTSLIQAILQTIVKDDGNLGTGCNIGESDENVEGYEYAFASVVPQFSATPAAIRFPIEKRRATAAPAPTPIFSAILAVSVL